MTNFIFHFLSVSSYLITFLMSMNLSIKSKKIKRPKRYLFEITKHYIFILFHHFISILLDQFFQKRSMRKILMLSSYFSNYFSKKHSTFVSNLLHSKKISSLFRLFMDVPKSIYLYLLVDLVVNL